MVYVIDPLSPEERAYDEGYVAWQEGFDPEDCPYASSALGAGNEDKQGDLFSKWLDGWEDGSLDDEHEDSMEEEEEDDWIAEDGVPWTDDEEDE